MALVCFMLTLKIQSLPPVSVTSDGPHSVLLQPIARALLWLQTAETGFFVFLSACSPITS